MYCSNCGNKCDEEDRFCSECGNALSQHKAPGGDQPASGNRASKEEQDIIAKQAGEIRQPVTPVQTAVPRWSAKGKISVIKHPLIKEKQPLKGEWKYADGVMKSKSLIGAKKVDFRSDVRSVELMDEKFTELAAMIVSPEISGALDFLAASSPILNPTHVARKTKKIARENVSFEVTLRSSNTFIALTNPEIFEEIARNIDLMKN
jgi:hypothetical protein